MRDSEYTIELLGPTVVRARGRVLPVNGQKRLGLIAILASRAGQDVSFDTIADEVWGSDNPRAVKSIRTYLSRFRNEDGIDYITSLRSGTALRMHLEANQVDVLDFGARVNEALHGERPAGERLERLRDALALWRGPALADVADQPWAVAEIQALDERRREAVYSAINARLELGEHRLLCPELEVIVASSPYDEAFWAQLMLALYRSGRQRDALRSFQRAREALRDLSIEPGPALRQLEHAILVQDPVLDLPTGEAPAPVGGRPPASAPGFESDLTWIRESSFGLVGRTGAVAEVLAVLESERRPLVILLEGAAGTGKTRLAAEIVRAAGDAPVVAFGSAHEGDRASFGLWERPVRRLLDQAGDLLRTDAVEQLENLLGRREQLDDHLEAVRPAGALADLLSLVGDPGPLLVLDNLHLADEASMSLVRQVLAAAPSLRVIATARPGDAAPPVFHELLDALDGDGSLHRVPIGPLSRESVDALVSDQQIEASVDDVMHATGGNAFLVTEVLLEARRNGRRAVLPVPTPGIADSLRRRMAGLSPSAVDLLQTAALLGDRFDGALAGAACGIALVEVGARLDELLADGIISPVAGDPGSYDFLHPLLAEATRDAVPGGSRPVRHRAIAEALETRLADGAPVDMGLLGEHWCAAGRVGDLDRAVTCLRLAGETATRRFAYETAQKHYEAAIDLLDRQGGPPAQRGRLLLALAEVENAAGDVNAAKAACREAATAARETADHDMLADAAIEYCGVIPMGSDHTDPEAVTLVTEAEAAPITAARRARLRARPAELDYWVQDRVQRLRLCRSARDLAAGDGSATLRAEVLIHSFWALNCADLLDERLEILRELDEAVQELGNLSLLLQSGKCRLHILLEMGDVAAASTVADRNRRLGERLGHADHRRLALQFSAMTAAMEGRIDECFELGGRARQMMEAAGHGFAARLAYETLVLPAHFFAGTMADAASWWFRLAEVDPGRPLWQGASAWIAAEIDDHDRAARHIELIDVASFVERERRVDWWPVLTGVSHAAVVLSDTELARLLYTSLVPFAGRNAGIGQSAFLGAVSHHLGRLAAELGDTEAAHDHLTDALVRHRRIGAERWMAATAELLTTVESRIRA